MLTLNVGERRLEPRRVFCIGRNYAAHAAELGNAVPESPVVFLKPRECLLSVGQPIVRPRHGRDLHFEAELVVVVGRTGRVTREADAPEAIAALGLGLDLTLRDVQDDLKKNGLPWEKSKAFDGSAPLGPLAPFYPTNDLSKLDFTCVIDGVTRQRGSTSLMLFSVPRLLVALSEVWELQAGDLIYTGTPPGVGPLAAGNTITVDGDFVPGPATWTVV